MLAADARSAWSIVTVFSFAKAGTGATTWAPVVAGSFWSQIFLELRKLFFGQVAA